MIKLLRIEFKKILTYKVFWILVGLYFLFLASGILLAEFIINSNIESMNRRLPIPLPRVNLYFFPWIWQNIAFFATLRYMLILPATVIMILVTNEFTFKTVRQNVINGMGRAEIITSKMLIILLFSVIMTLFYAIGTIILGISNTADVTPGLILRNISFIPGFFVTMLTFLVYALFFAFLLRNTGLAIAIFTLYTFIVEPILYYFLKSPLVFENNISPYLPVNAVLRVTEYPSLQVLKMVSGIDLQTTVTWETALLPVGYAALMLVIIYRVMAKRDL